jgi:hypothetical protein
MTNCTQRSTIKRYFDFQKVSVILDVISDALSKSFVSLDSHTSSLTVVVICFPVVILWNVRISLRKKIILCCTFGLAALTIAVTIVRGSVFGGTYKKFDRNEMRNLNTGWMWFWIFIEFAVGKSAKSDLHKYGTTKFFSVPHCLHHLVPSPLCATREESLRKPSASPTDSFAGTASIVILKASKKL